MIRVSNLTRSLFGISSFLRLGRMTLSGVCLMLRRNCIFSLVFAVLDPSDFVEG